MINQKRLLVKNATVTDGYQTQPCADINTVSIASALEKLEKREHNEI